MRSSLALKSYAGTDLTVVAPNAVEASRKGFEIRESDDALAIFDVVDGRRMTWADARPFVFAVVAGVGMWAAVFVSGLVHF